LVVRQPLGQFAMEMAHIIDDKMLAYHFWKVFFYSCVQLPEVSSKDILGILSKDQIFMNQSKRKHKECSLLTNGEVNGWIIHSYDMGCCYTAPLMTWW
jgi:hypothetical protein